MGKTAKQIEAMEKRREELRTKLQQLRRKEQRENNLAKRKADNHAKILWGSGLARALKDNAVINPDAVQVAALASQTPQDAELMKDWMAAYLAKPNA